MAKQLSALLLLPQREVSTMKRVFSGQMSLLLLAACLACAATPARADMLYVGIANDRIVTYDTASPNSTATTFASGQNGVRGLAFDASGNLYAAEFFSNTIMKFTPGGVGSVFASSGLNGPFGLAFDAAGDLYAANYFNDNIERFTPDGVGSVFATTPGIPLFIASSAPAAVPEPSSLALLSCAALTGAAWALRRHRRRN